MQDMLDAVITVMICLAKLWNPDVRKLARRAMIAEGVTDQMQESLTAPVLGPDGGPAGVPIGTAARAKLEQETRKMERCAH